MPNLSRRNALSLAVAPGAYRVIVAAISLGAIGLLSSAQAVAQAEPKFVIKPVAEKKLKELPAGPLYWRVETFATLAQAQAAEGATSLAAEVAGKIWLFTLGQKGGATSGGNKVVEIGPVPAISASEYLLRINHAGGPPPAPRRLCIRIRARRPSTCCPAGLGKRLRTA
jgi:hypothetical protein